MFSLTFLYVTFITLQKRLDPVVVEENTHKKVQYVYIPSPSRSATSMTSGDLADISSSLSRSSVSSGSLGSKVSFGSTGSSSLEQAASVHSVPMKDRHTSLDQQEAPHSLDKITEQQAGPDVTNMAGKSCVPCEETG